MRDGDALLKAVDANPDCDTTRLAYADWLDEQDADSTPCLRCKPSTSDGLVGIVANWRPCGSCNSTGVISYRDEAFRQRLHVQLKRVCGSPDDDALRLECAAVYENYGRADRGEFIRVQVELATGVRPHPNGHTVVTKDGRFGIHPDVICRRDDCHLCHLRRRERELLDDHGDRWRTEATGAWGVLLLGVTGFHRGFVSHLTCASDDWSRHADAIAWHPIQTKVCEGCHGSESRGFAGHGNWRQSECPNCIGTGRIPRPFPPTAHPITSVTLTTAPRWEWVVSGRPSRVPSLPRSLVRLAGRERTTEVLATTSVSDRVATLLKAEWPWIKFTIPEEARA